MADALVGADAPDHRERVMNSNTYPETARSPRVRHHPMAPWVAAHGCAEEWKIALLAPYDSVERGGKKFHPRLVQLAKDVRRGHNAAPFTVMRLLLDPLKLGADLELVRMIPRVLDGIIKSHHPEPVRLSFEEVQVIETEIECLMNPIQIAIAQGDKSTPRKRQLYDYVVKAIAILERMRDLLARDLFGPRGPVS